MVKCLLFAAAVALSSCSTTFYVVRHAEKEAATNMMTSDVPLSAAGRQRAEALKNKLDSRQVRHIFSTNYIRTRATAQPLSEALGVPIAHYAPGDTTFVSRLKALDRGNVLIVGHSNTVDDLVNALAGKPLLQDLPETRYGDLFIIKKKGKHYTCHAERFDP